MIPDEMKSTDQWIVWTAKDRKKPYAPWKEGDYPIDPLESSNWTSFQKALRFVRHGDYDGLGFVFTPEDDFVGFDLDDGVSDIRISGNNVSVDVDEIHNRILSALNSFTEVSQSETGLHVIVKGDLDKFGGQVTDKESEIEIYDRGRFFCMTGKVVTDYSLDVEEAQSDIDNIIEAFVDESSSKSSDIASDYSQDGFSGSGFDASEFEPVSDSEFDQLSFFDLFEDVYPGSRTAHPVHGSRTNSNFLVHDDDGYVATCFRGSCNYGNGPTCVLLPQHVLAMELKGWDNCSRVREEWDLDLKVDTWVYAVENYGLNPVDVPVSILAGLGERYDVDPFVGGRESVSMINFLKKKLSEDYGVAWF